MCGIGGIVNLSEKNTKLDKSNINIIRKILKSRGSDSDKIWISKKKDTALTIQRLATQDQRSIANQPCFSSDQNIILIMNGEIYNHRQLKKILIKHNYKFLSNNDAEVAANAYHFWGKKFLNKLDGQFAIFALDQRTNEGLIARDKHGISPLFYCSYNNRLVFSSNPESIHKQLKLKLEISKKGFADFLVSGCMTENNTFFEKIKYLSPGSYIDFKVNKLFKKQKSYLKKEKKISLKKISNPAKEITLTLLKSVKTRLQGNKKVGIFLSGGIDSVLLLAIYKKLFPKLKIKTFTAIFERNSKQYLGESKQTKKICKYFKCKNYIVKIKRNDIVNYLKTSSYPSTGILEYSFKKLGEKAKKNKTDVIFSGEGADEMFFGYDHNLAMIGIFKKKFSFLKKKHKIKSALISKKNLASANIQDLFLIGGANIDLENNRKKIFTSQILSTRPLRTTIINHTKKYKLNKPKDVEKIIVNLDYDIKIPELQIRRAEGPVMSNAVEMRFPYLDSKLLQQVLSTPLSHKIVKGSKEKILLRKIAKNFMPQELTQQNKLPFGLPAVEKNYFNNSNEEFKRPAFSLILFQNYKRMKRIVLGGKYRKLNFINGIFLENICIQQSELNTCFFSPLLWKIWSFAEWFERESKKV